MMKDSRLFLQLMCCLLAGLVKPNCDWEESEDPNPNTPVFDREEWHIVLTPDTPVGYEILQANATDLDVNDTLWYSLESFPFEEYFSINDTDGLLTTSKSLMAIPALNVECLLLVQDREDIADSVVKTDRAKVNIEIYALHRYRPSFEHGQGLDTVH